MNFTITEVEGFDGAGQQVTFVSGGETISGHCSGLFVHQIGETPEAPEEPKEGGGVYKIQPLDIPVYSEPALLVTPEGGKGEWFDFRSITRFRLV